MTPWSPPPASERDYYTVAEIAEKTGYDTERVRQLADQGTWPCDRVQRGSLVERRFPKNEIDKLTLARARGQTRHEMQSSSELDYLRKRNETLHAELEQARSATKLLEEQLAAQQSETRRLRNAVAALTDPQGTTVDEVEAYLRRQ